MLIKYFVFVKKKKKKKKKKKSTNYVDQLDKPQSVSLCHLALLPRGVESYQGTPMGIS